MLYAELRRQHVRQPTGRIVPFGDRFPLRGKRGMVGIRAGIARIANAVGLKTSEPNVTYAPDALKKVVPEVRLELTRPKSEVFETSASAIPPLGPVAPYAARRRHALKAHCIS